MKPEVKADKNKRVVSTAFIASAQISRLNKMVMSEADVMKEEIKEIPDSKLYIRYRGNLVLFTERRKGKIYGITRERDLVYALARRQYLELHMEMLEQIIEEGWTAETEQIINDYYPQIEALLKRFEDAGLDIGIITMTPDQRIWNADRHSKSAFRREDLKYPTSKGRVYMRSKSEQLIGDLLEELYIPYRYEPEVTINNRTYHPDFVIMLANGRLVILEHAGRMDLQEYREGLIMRLQAYDSIGLLIGRNVFVSFEHDTKDKALIKEVIFQMLTADPVKNRILQSAAVRVGCKVGAA